MYYDVQEALCEIDPVQVKITLGREDEHEIHLSGLCSDGVGSVLNFIVNEMEWSHDELVEAIPQLKSLSVSDLLSAALSGDQKDLMNMIPKKATSSSGSTYNSGNITTGDVFTATRKVIADYGNTITYEDDQGRQHNVLKRSFKGWAKNKKKA